MDMGIFKAPDSPLFQINADMVTVLVDVGKEGVMVIPDEEMTKSGMVAAVIVFEAVLSVSLHSSMVFSGSTIK